MIESIRDFVKDFLKMNARGRAWILWIVFYLLIECLPFGDVTRNVLLNVNTYIAFRQLRVASKKFMLFECGVVVGVFLIWYLLAGECLLCFEHNEYYLLFDIEILLYNTYRNYKIESNTWPLSGKSGKKKGLLLVAIVVLLVALLPLSVKSHNPIVQDEVVLDRGFGKCANDVSVVDGHADKVELVQYAKQLQRIDNVTEKSISLLIGIVNKPFSLLYQSFFEGQNEMVVQGIDDAMINRNTPDKKTFQTKATYECVELKTGSHVWFHWFKLKEFYVY